MTQHSPTTPKGLEFDEAGVITEMTSYPFNFLMPQTLPPKTYYSHDEVMQMGLQLARSQHDRLLAKVLPEFERIEEVLDYCEPHLDHMWAATVVGILLKCDFREAREAIESYRKFRGDE